MQTASLQKSAPLPLSPKSLAGGKTSARARQKGARPYPEGKFDLERKIGRTPTKQDILLAGMLSKENLLDLIRNFIVFDREGGKIVKKVARYQQFEAVNEAIRRITDPTSKQPLKDRGGVVWHTQGSGKSLSMLWLCLKLRRVKELNNPSLLIVTDRRDLDRQINQTFMYCGFENPIRASRVRHLRKLLNGPSGQPDCILSNQ